MKTLVQTVMESSSVVVFGTIKHADNLHGDLIKTFKTRDSGAKRISLLELIIISLPLHSPEVNCEFTGYHGGISKLWAFCQGIWVESWERRKGEHMISQGQKREEKQRKLRSLTRPWQKSISEHFIHSFSLLFLFLGPWGAKYNIWCVQPWSYSYNKHQIKRDNAATRN